MPNAAAGARTFVRKKRRNSCRNLYKASASLQDCADSRKVARGLKRASPEGRWDAASFPSKTSAPPANHRAAIRNSCVKEPILKSPFSARPMRTFRRLSGIIVQNSMGICQVVRKTRSLVVIKKPIKLERVYGQLASTQRTSVWRKQCCVSWYLQRLPVYRRYLASRFCAKLQIKAGSNR